MTIPADMIAIETDGAGGPEILRTSRLPVPAPRAGEVLIRVAAAGVNGPDLAQRRGNYPAPDGHSNILGLEVSGEIVAGAGEWRTGDRVVALCNGGGYAGYVAVPAGQVLPAPAGWDLADAAALPETWFTIAQTLVMRAGLEAGMHVLVTGAAGGLGGTAIQVARILGAIPIAICGSAEKADYALSLGAEAVIRHDSEDIVARTRELTGGRGADRILDMLGGAATGRLVDAAARGGHIVLVASLEGSEGNFPLSKMVLRQLTLSGSTLRHQTSDTKAAIAAHIRRYLWPALAAGTLPRPRIQRFSLADAARAHRAMEDRANYGKIVLTV